MLFIFCHSLKSYIFSKPCLFQINIFTRNESDGCSILMRARENFDWRIKSGLRVAKNPYWIPMFPQVGGSLIHRKSLWILNPPGAEGRALRRGHELLHTGGLFAAWILSLSHRRFISACITFHRYCLQVSTVANCSTVMCGWRPGKHKASLCWSSVLTQLGLSHIFPWQAKE